MGIGKAEYGGIYLLEDDLILEIHILQEYLHQSIIRQHLINWRHSGFSVDASVHIPAGSSNTRESSSKYIARPPLFLMKTSTEEINEATVISCTPDTDFFKGEDQTLFREAFLPGTDATQPPEKQAVYSTVRITIFN
jgi:hypothetical protein